MGSDNEKVVVAAGRSNDEVGLRELGDKYLVGDLGRYRGPIEKIPLLAAGVLSNR